MADRVFAPKVGKESRISAVFLTPLRKEKSEMAEQKSIPVRQLVGQILKRNPSASGAEISRYVFKAQGKPDWNKKPYPLSGTLIAAVRKEMGIVPQRKESAISREAPRQNESSQVKGLPSERNPIHKKVEELLKKNPSMPYSAIQEEVTKAGLNGYVSYAILKMKKKLGIPLKPQGAALGSGTKGRLYLKLLSFPTTEMKEETKQAIIKFAEALNATGRIQMQVVELANPKELEVREMEQTRRGA
jgi:hypothetical protein